MGSSKTTFFNDEQNEIAVIAKVFSHPARVAILQHLFKMNACVCGDLVEEIGLSQPTISQHLKELKNLGIIKGTTEGTSVCYCINNEVWHSKKQLLIGFLNQDSACVDNCCS